MLECQSILKLLISIQTGKLGDSLPALFSIIISILNFRFSESDDDLDYAITSIKRNGVAIKGNIETKSEQAGITSRNVALRNELDLFVSVLHCKSYEGVRSHHQGVDLVVVRQNTEGEYAMLEHESVPGVVESMKIITVEASERLSRYAFEYARQHGRKKVTTIHKANIMKLSDGCFLETSRRIAKEFPDIKHDDMIIGQYIG